MAASLRDELGVEPPDIEFGSGRDIESIPQAVRWSAGVARRLLGSRALRRDVFGPDARICIVHGDTPSTLLATMLARRVGIEVVHLEAGLRSWNVWHPFPEELIRIAVMRMSGLLFAPDDTAVDNLASMKVRGRVVPVNGNTSIDAVRAAFGPGAEYPAPASGPAIVTMHRVENLHRRPEVEGFLALVARIANDHPVQFVVHGPTLGALRDADHERLAADGVEVVPLLAHHDFTRRLAAAPVVVTDGGSVQEECALLGVPTLLWRHHTERPDGIGENVLLLHGHPHAADAVLEDLERFRRPPSWRDRSSPADAIVDHLIDHLR